MKWWFKSGRKLLKEKQGSMVSWTIAFVLMLLFVILGVSEYFRLMITASGIKDATESAVISVINDNYNEVYHSVREGYAAGYEPSKGSFRVSVDKGDVYGRLAYLLGLSEEDNVYIRTDFEGKTEYSITGLKVQIANNGLASGNGTYTATVTLKVNIPVRFGGKDMIELPIILQVKAAFRERF